MKNSYFILPPCSLYHNFAHQTKTALKDATLSSKIIFKVSRMGFPKGTVKNKYFVFFICIVNVV